MQVEFEDFLQEIGRDDLFFQFSRGARFFRGLFRLLFQFDALQSQQVFGALDWIFQGAVGVVEHGALLQAPGTFLIFSLSENVWMETAAQGVELFFKRGRIQVELAGESKESEIVDWDRRLHFAARTAEVRGAHRAAGPATWSGLGGRSPNCHERRFGFHICHNKIQGERAARPLINLVLTTGLWPVWTGRRSVTTRALNLLRERTAAAAGLG